MRSLLPEREKARILGSLRLGTSPAVWHGASCRANVCSAHICFYWRQL